MDALNTSPRGPFRGSASSGREAASSGAEDPSQQIAALQQIGLAELRSEWRRLFRTQTPNLSRDLLMRALAYRVQERAHGGLTKATQRKLASLAAVMVASPAPSLCGAAASKNAVLTSRCVREISGDIISK